jgi:hypothetical protein
MKFVIDETYRITSDRNQWIIQRRRKRKGKVVWEGFKFFTTFDQCVQRLGEMLCRELDTEGVSEALAGIDTVSAKLTAALSPCFEVVAVFEEENTPCREFREKVASPASSKPHHANTGSSGGEA